MYLSVQAKLCLFAILGTSTKFVCAASQALLQIFFVFQYVLWKQQKHVIVDIMTMEGKEVFKNVRLRRIAEVFVTYSSWSPE